MSGPAQKIRHPDRVGLHLRIVLQQGAIIGPGRADLLENIRDLGSIAAAARAMGMSYRRAWLLVDAMSKEFGAPVIAAAAGGADGGRASLTEKGQAVIQLYRRIEAKASAAVAHELRSLHRLVAQG